MQKIILFICLILCKVSIFITFPTEFFSSSIFHHFLQNTTSNKTRNTDILNRDDPEMLGKFITKYLTSYLNMKVKNDSTHIRPVCIEYISSIVNDSEKYRYDFDNKFIKNKTYSSREMIIKLLLDSSKSQNELNYYDNCQEMSHLNYSPPITNYSFLVLVFDKSNNIGNESESIKKTRLDYDDNFFLYSFCVPDNGSCNHTEYKNIYNSINKQFNYVFSPKESQIKSYMINNRNKIYENIPQSIIILIIFGLIIFIFIFHYPIFLLLKLCFRKKKINQDITNDNDKENEDNIKKEIYLIPKWLIMLDNSFSFSENYEELFNLKSNTDSVNNFSGLTEIRGLEAISMLLTVLGFTFIGVYNCPLKFTGLTQIRILLSHVLYFPVFIGLRYSPRILISCSGYSFIYKFLNYIDKNIEYLSIWRFFMRQSYKYIILMLLILFFRYSLNILFIFFQGNLPIWTFLHKIIIKTSDEENKIKFWLGFIGFNSFYQDKSKRIEQDLYDYFWLPFNEIFFFIFGIILITIGFKYKLRIDIFILILLPITFIGKIIFSYLFSKDFYATLYYYMFDYGEFMTNPLFNLSYYLIGLYFGLMNYVLQKGAVNKFDTSIYSKISSFSFLKNDEKSSLFNEDNDEQNKEKKEEKDNDEQNKEKKEEKDNDDKEENENENKNKKNININDEDKKINDDECNKLNSDINEKGNKNEEKEKEEEDDNINQENNLQDSMKYNQEEETKFPFLKLPIKYINFRKYATSKAYNALFYLLSLIIFGLPLAYHYIFLDFNVKKKRQIRENKDKNNGGIKPNITLVNENIKILNLEDFISDTFLNAFLRIDIEFFVLFIQWMFFILNIRGQNNILSFFTHIVWGIFSKSYFSFSIICNMVILFTIYSTETLISLNIYSIYLYFIFNSILILFWMSISYIFLELPFKKIFKYILSNDEEHDDKYVEENLEQDDDEDE